MCKHEITAIIYNKKGHIISIGKNSYVKTHPLQAKYAKNTGTPQKIYLHAEVHAIVKCRDLKLAHKMVITRFNTQGDALLAKPCPSCMMAINVAGIKIIEHT